MTLPSPPPPRLTLDGLDLATCLIGVDDTLAAFGLPGVATGNASVVGRHGELFQPRKMFAPQRVDVPMWVAGRGAAMSDPSWSVYVGGHDALMDVLSVRGRLMPLIHTRLDGTRRRLMVEILSAVPAVKKHDFYPLGGYRVAMVAPYPFWDNPDDLTGTTVSTALGTSWNGATRTMTLTHLDTTPQANAPVDDSVVTIINPPAQLSVLSTDPLNGLLIDGAAIAAAAGAGADYAVRINSVDWTVEVGTVTRTLQYTNRHLNPSVETNATGYSQNGGIGGVPARFTGGVLPTNGGLTWLKVIAASAGDIATFISTFDATTFTAMGLVANQAYNVSIHVRLAPVSPGTSRNMQLAVQCFNNSNVLLGTLLSAITPVARAANINTLASWVRLDASGTLPVGTTKVAAFVATAACVTNDEVHYDAAQITDGVTLRAFFDGNTVPGGEWTGTVNNSRSTYSTFTDPATWTPYTGPGVRKVGGARFLSLVRNSSRIHTVLVSSTSLAGLTGGSRVDVRSRKWWVTG